MAKCDPCAGKNPAAWAAQAQTGNYNKDSWRNTVLKKGTVIFGGAPGQTGFYMDAATLASAGGSQSELWGKLQVEENRKYGYRKTVQGYMLKKDTCVATGHTLANPQYGKGGGTQYYLADYKSAVSPVGSLVSLPKP